MSAPIQDDAPDLGLMARAIGVVTAPGKTFPAIVRAPRPASILFLICLLIGLATGLPQLGERGWRTMLDAQVRQAESMTGRPVTDDVRAMMERRAPYSGYITFATTFVGVPIFSMIVTAVFWGIFNIVLAGSATFKQVLGIVAHAQVISALGTIVAAPIIFATGFQSVVGPFHLGALVPMLDPDSFLVRLLSNIGFFMLWQIVVLAVGLGVLYRRRPTWIAVFLIALYVLATAGFTSAFSAVLHR